MIRSRLSSRNSVSYFTTSEPSERLIQISRETGPRLFARYISLQIALIGCSTRQMNNARSIAMRLLQPSTRSGTSSNQSGLQTWKTARIARSPSPLSETAAVPVSRRRILPLRSSSYTSHINDFGRKVQTGMAMSSDKLF